MLFYHIGINGSNVGLQATICPSSLRQPNLLKSTSMNITLLLDYRLATQNMHPGGIFGDHFFGKLIHRHRQVEIRLSAKIPTLGKAVRALFFF